MGFLSFSLVQCFFFPFSFLLICCLVLPDWALSTSCACYVVFDIVWNLESASVYFSIRHYCKFHFERKEVWITIHFVHLRQWLDYLTIFVDYVYMYIYTLICFSLCIDIFICVCSIQPVSTKGKPTKLHKRKHQIGSLYFDMRQKEMELAERRSKGFLTKAETQAKYGWWSWDNSLYVVHWNCISK